MNGNLPPGVTGNEYQIAGPDREFDATRECDSQGFSTMTITEYAKTNLERAIEALNRPLDMENAHQITALAVAFIRNALSDVMTADVDGECPFASDVTIEEFMGVETWECPLCRVLHETEVE